MNCEPDRNECLETCAAVCLRSVVGGILLLLFRAVSFLAAADEIYAFHSRYFDIVQPAFDLT
ncbi:MAG: hypothetical protein GXP31_07890 [Kiritimatiellaeota bacterium]|nr:hypothetical protein [Kiritimatiellota bacterium]